VIRHLATLPLDTDGIIVPRERKIDATALGVLRRFVQADGGLEAGGVFLGRYIVDSQAIVIDEATEPAPGDERLPRNFHRLDEAHNVRVMDAWRASDGRVHYLGEWHTHSEPFPVPSPLDCEAWLGLYGDVRDQHDGSAAPLVFAIVGQQAIGFWEVGP
jgi:integrative and conjugative element protein (TIGR02256 family)